MNGRFAIDMLLKIVSSPLKPRGLPFIISISEMTPFLSAAADAGMPKYMWHNVVRHGQGGLLSPHSRYDTVVAVTLLLLFVLAVIPLHSALAPDEIHCYSVIYLQLHKPIHYGMLLWKLIKSCQRSMAFHHLHNQTFRSAAICSETQLVLLCQLYWEWHGLGEGGFYLWILIPCTGHFMLWLLSYLWEINLDSATCLLLYSLFITWYTVFN